MKKDKNTFKTFLRKLYYVLFFVITLVVIYLMFPKQGSFKYEYQKGLPWRHATLIAPFDFPILKPAEVLQAEKDSMLQNFLPYLVFDSLVGQKMLATLKTDLINEINTITENINSDTAKDLVEKVTVIFSSFYSNGLLENDVSSYPMLADKAFVNVVKNNIAERVTVDRIESLKTAYVILNEKIYTELGANVTLLQAARRLNPDDYLEANLTYDSHYNDQIMAEMLSGLSTTRGVVQSGVRIISQGDMVNNENFVILESLRQSYERNYFYSGWASPVIIGQMLLIIILFAILVLYLQSFNRLIFWKKRNFSMIIAVLLVTFILARLIYENNQLNLYLLPICILPVIIRTFLGARMALYIHIITVLLISFMVPNSFEYAYIQIVAGTVAVVSLSKLHRRGHLIYTSILVLVAYAVMFLAFEMIKEGGVSDIPYTELKWFLGSAVLLTIAYPLIWIIERIFGFISDVTLLELSDTNNPLLRKLAEIAPGTFQHSMQVANLAEEAILRIGGNPMLVRAGALYHDIGKINSSQFFIENLSEASNPHEKLSHLKSVEKIVSHVTDGVVLARKHKLPEPLIDFIKMHHGKGVVKYFYLKYKEENPGADVKEEDFMYPGPNPNSRETAVVMLADGVEAAARSLPEKNEHTLKNIVDQIIDSKIQNHELDNAPITFRDIREIKEVFIEKLKNIYHLRIQYPSENKNSK